MTTTTDAQTFRTLVAEVATRAKAILPSSINGRLEGAVKLVLAHDITRLDDGSIEVGSCTDPLKTYRLVGTTCECKDFTDGKAPEGWCRHRIAAGIAKRVQELLPPAPEPQATVAATVASEPLYEARSSANVRLTIGGREVQLTLRDHDEARLLVRLEEVLQRYPAPPPAASPARPQALSPQQQNAAAMHRPVSGFCAVHNVAMQWNEGKDGRKGWHSHRTPEGQWCKGK
jgi:hypothetical protein